jgi:signal transduction histidine kinase
MDSEMLQTFAKLSHAVNNPLQGVVSGTELLGMRLGDDARSQELLAQIRESAKEISAIVKQASTQAKEYIKQTEEAG